jgi:hypothetical protein
VRVHWERLRSPLGLVGVALVVMMGVAYGFISTRSGHPHHYAQLVFSACGLLFAAWLLYATWKWKQKA